MPILLPFAFTFKRQVVKVVMDWPKVAMFSHNFSSEMPTRRENGATKMALNPVFLAGRTI